MRDVRGYGQANRAFAPTCIPATEDSPIRQRPPGLNSMSSFEVPDLDAVVAQARAAGFEVPDPRIGTLPGTRVTTISADQMSGLNLQLLQYV